MFRPENSESSSGRKNWRNLQLSRSEIGTTNTLQCQSLGNMHSVQELRKMTIIIARRLRNMGSSARDNLVY